MDIREENFRLTVKACNHETEFLIDFDEVMVIIASVGKPVSIMLTDTVGEIWSISVIKAQVEIDTKQKAMELIIR